MRKLPYIVLLYPAEPLLQDLWFKPNAWGLGGAAVISPKRYVKYAKTVG